MHGIIDANMSDEHMGCFFCFILGQVNYKLVIIHLFRGFLHTAYKLVVYEFYIYCMYLDRLGQNLTNYF